MEYSVVIRTLGTAGEKYAELLKSVERQTVKAKEVVVVIAEGYEPTPYHTSNERIVYTRKGMVNQRLPAFENLITDGVNGYLFKPGDGEALTHIFTTIVDNYSKDFIQPLREGMATKRDDYEKHGDIISVFREAIASLC